MMKSVHKYIEKHNKKWKSRKRVMAPAEQEDRKKLIKKTR